MIFLLIIAYISVFNFLSLVVMISLHYFLTYLRCLSTYLLSYCYPYVLRVVRLKF